MLDLNTMMVNNFEDVDFKNLQQGQHILMVGDLDTNDTLVLTNMFLIKKYFESIYCFKSSELKSQMYIYNDELCDIDGYCTHEYKTYLLIDNIKIFLDSYGSLDDIYLYDVEDYIENENDGERFLEYKDRINVMLSNNGNFDYNNNKVNNNLIFKISNNDFLICDIDHHVSRVGWSKNIKSIIYNIQFNKFMEVSIDMDYIEKLKYYDERIEDIITLYNYDINGYIKNPEYLEHVISILNHEKELRHIFKCFYKDDRIGFKGYNKNISYISLNPELFYVCDDGSYHEINRCVRKATTVLKFELSREAILNPYTGEVISDYHEKIYEDVDSIILKGTGQKGKRFCFIKMDELFVPTTIYSETQYVESKLEILNKLAN